MITIFLAIHVVLALITCGAAARAVWQTSQQSEATSQSLVAMWASFAGVIVSGIGLMIVLPGSLGRACALMSAFIVLTSGVQLHYHRTIARA